MRRRSQHSRPVRPSPRRCRDPAAPPCRGRGSAARRFLALLRRSDAPLPEGGLSVPASRPFAARERFGMELSMKTSVALALAMCLLAGGALAQQYKVGPIE